MKPRLHWAAAAAAALVLAACGGGSDDAPIRSVRVVGDSLSDSGTFGLKYTVQGAAATGAGSTPIWPERVAAQYGQSLCAHYVATPTGFANDASCTNYAVAGGAINFTRAPTAPQSIIQQLKDAGVNGYGQGDLLLVDGGGNDASDLIGAYLAAGQDGGASYAALLGTLLDAGAVQRFLAGGTEGAAQAGGAYMQALAVRFAETIRTHALDRGARHVSILNMPGVTLTPKFRMVLGSIAQSRGEAAAAQAEALFDAWVQAFNARLAAEFAGVGAVRVVDFYGAFKDQYTRPAEYGYTDVRRPACPVTGVDGSGLPTYDMRACTASALSQMTPPAGATGGANWWKTFAFSDSFHPTPYAHQLMGDMVIRDLERAGWR